MTGNNAQATFFYVAVQNFLLILFLSNAVNVV